MVLTNIITIVEVLNDISVTDKEYQFNLCLNDSYTVTSESDNISITYTVTVTKEYKSHKEVTVIVYNNLLGDITITNIV